MPLATTRVSEGSAELIIPEQSLQDPFHTLAFYNTRMSFNRSLSSLALGCALPLLEGGEVLDGLCSLGARGLRYLKENKGVKRVTFGEANPHALKLLKRNLALNKIPKSKCEVWSGDLNRSLLGHKRLFDFVELDPFGSPVFYFESVLRRVHKKSVFSITATDLANLFGSKPKPALRHYDARAVRCEYGHELALRILVGKIVRSAAVLDYAAKPLLSFFEGHAAKCVALVEKGAPLADNALREIGFVSHCPKCLHRENSRWPIEKCSVCGGRMEPAGPLWLGKLCEEEFLDCLSKENGVRHYNEKTEIFQLLSLLREENSLPQCYFDLHSLAQKAGLPAPATAKVIERLRSKGFQASGTHFSTQGVRTNASAAEVSKVLGK